MIESTVACPELLPQPGSPDVRIQYGVVADALGEEHHGQAADKVNPDAFLLNIPAIAKYLVLGGKEIIVEPAPGVPEDEVRLYLLGSAFGALFHQRGLLPLHGCALEVDGGAVVFLGAAGHGKSTLAAVLYQKGYRVITDDVSVLSFSPEGRPMVQPSCRHLKLRPEVIESLGKNPAAYPRVTSELAKHLLPLGDEFCSQSRPVNQVYELATHDSQGFQITPLQGTDKLTALITHTYRLAFLEGPVRRKHYFEQCGRVARQIPVSRFFRPRWPFRLEEQAEFLEEKWF